MKHVYIYILCTQINISMHGIRWITLITPIAGMGMITNIGSPHDRLGAHVGSVILVIALLSLRQIVITHISIALAHCDKVKNTIDK